MVDKSIIEKLAKVPVARPGFDALGLSAPLLLQMNPEGKWENKIPNNLQEGCLKEVVQHLVNSQAVSAAQSYCCQCAAENHKECGQSNYVPIIMMPIYPADKCPFDLDCEMHKVKEAEAKPSTKPTKKKNLEETEKDKEKKMPKKRNFVLQRLNDFDLLSQW